MELDCLLQIVHCPKSGTVKFDCKVQNPDHQICIVTLINHHEFRVELPEDCDCSDCACPRCGMSARWARARGSAGGGELCENCRWESWDAMEARAEERIQEKANREANKRKFRNLEWEDIKTAFRQGKSWKETAERLACQRDMRRSWLKA